MNFFPIDENSFIDKIMNEIKELSDIDDWNDVYHTIIDDETYNNSIGDNIMIINEYAGDVFEAIELYEDRIGDFERTKNKHVFYARLAFVSIYEKFYGIIENLIDDM